MSGPLAVAVLADARQAMARLVVPALLESLADDARTRPAVLLVPDRPGVLAQRVRWHRQRSERRRQIARGAGRWDAQLDVEPPDLPRAARRVGAEVLRLPGGDPNGVAALDALVRLHVDALVVVGSLARVGDGVLGAVRTAVNLHAGDLPRQRGLGVAAWAVHDAPSWTAATFHRVTAGIDEGAVLAATPVPVHVDDVPADVAVRVGRAAVALLPPLLDALARDDPGRPQVGIAGVHDRAARHLAGTVDDPSALGVASWERRLRAFAPVRTRVGGRTLEVTRVEVCPAVVPLQDARCACGRPAWTTSDGAVLHVDAVRFRPFRARRSLLARRPLRARWAYRARG